LCCGKEDIGCIAIEDKGNYLSLNYIAILPAYQGQGIGAKLIGDLLKETASKGIPLQLNVLKVNPARKLYERLGFRVIGEDEYRYCMLA
jgi:ribosomal protein S18 acetylase RimI-like enzyme